MPSWNCLWKGILRFKLEKSQNIVGRDHYRGSGEAKNADTNVDSGVCATEAAEGNKGFIGDWAWKSCLSHSSQEHSYVLPIP